MTEQVHVFLLGAVTLGCFLVGVKFLKFWRSSRDRFFLWFASAFFAFAVGWVVSAFGTPSEDHVHYVYVPRLVAFVLIIAAVLDKNRKKAAR